MRWYLHVCTRFAVHLHENMSIIGLSPSYASRNALGGMPPWALMPPFQGNESIHSYFCFIDQNRFLQTVFEYVMFVYVVHVSLAL